MYNIGKVYYMKKDYKFLQKNEMVEIVERKKNGRHTFVRVKNIKNETSNFFSVKKLKKRQ